MIVNVLLWCLLGLIAGAVAQFLMPGRDPGQSWNIKGFVITTVLGILGALLGGYLSSVLFSWSFETFSWQSLLVAIGGAVLLLIVYRVVATVIHRATPATRKGP
jgi:uncharacterized membrane protein YeaQ/YmgE (transglycosylase-associated protein family)